MCHEVLNTVEGVDSPPLSPSSASPLLHRYPWISVQGAAGPMLVAISHRILLYTAGSVPKYVHHSTTGPNACHALFNLTALVGFLSSPSSGLLSAFQASTFNSRALASL